MANSVANPVLISGEKTVAVAGTRVALAAAQRVKSLTVIAKVGNTGQVYLGGSDVAATTNDGLDARESLDIAPVNWLDLADLFLDADVNGEGVDFYAVKA